MPELSRHCWAPKWGSRRGLGFPVLSELPGSSTPLPSALHTGAPSKQTGDPNKAGATVGIGAHASLSSHVAQPWAGSWGSGLNPSAAVLLCGLRQVPAPLISMSVCIVMFVVRRSS